MTDITIVGLGIRNIGQLTLEAADLLKGATRVLALDMGDDILAWLQEHCSNVTTLYTYTESAGRLDAYREMASQVIDAALDGPVVFAIQGHPTVFVYAPVLVQDAAATLGLSVRVLPGISAMDGLFADLVA